MTKTTGTVLFTVTVCGTTHWNIQSSSRSQVALCLFSLVGVCHHLRQTVQWSTRPSRCSARSVWHQWPHSDPTRRGRRRNSVQKDQVQPVLSKVDEFATFKKVEVHAENSTF